MLIIRARSRELKPQKKATGGRLRDYSDLPAAAPDDQAHWKLKPPRWPVTSTTSPIKNSPGTFRLSIVLLESSSVSTPPAVTSALSYPSVSSGTTLQA